LEEELDNIKHRQKALDGEREQIEIEYRKSLTKLEEGHGDFLRKLGEALSSQRDANNIQKDAVNTHLTSHSYYNSQQIQQELDRLAISIPSLRFTISITKFPLLRRSLQNTLDGHYSRGSTCCAS